MAIWQIDKELFYFSKDLFCFVCVNKKQRLPAGDDAVGVATVKRDCLDFVIGHDNEPWPGRFRLRNNPQVRNGRFRFKHFDLLDNDGSHFVDRVVRLGINGADHFALVGTDNEDVVSFAISGADLRIDGQFREFIPFRKEK